VLLPVRLAMNVPKRRSVFCGTRLRRVSPTEAFRTECGATIREQSRTCPYGFSLSSQSQMILPQPGQPPPYFFRNAA